ncbi:hypothetical protein [Corynebacterium sp. sy039]|uniref:Rv3212 family protein n=1 Tax=Corynebacterium sp. sy039 TaxID=2599641 RepID=UPI0011B7F92D|nr:hypothetical protein [Corynebacterium sp. sy039]QDZ42144.1 hypothetical protein FQV43_02370 [Corynebacterium sp. sy039]
MTQAPEQIQTQKSDRDNTDVNTATSLAVTPGFSKKNWIICGVISIVSIAALICAWLSAPIRQAHLTVLSHYEESATAPTIPTSFSGDRGSFPADSFNHKPIVTNGLVISAHNTGSHSVVSAINPENNKQVWSYERDAALCALSTLDEKVVLVFATGVGCGDVVGIDATTGDYAGTRSAIASEHSALLRSNSYVGVVSSTRLELWRPSDFVRTVEYGKIPAKQEPNQQPHENCTIASALTRTELLASVDICDGQAWLRFQKTTPEDSREPKIEHEVKLDNPQAQLVSIGQEGAAVYVPGPQPSIISYQKDGQVTARTKISTPPELVVDPDSHVFNPKTADLPHHMSWFDGHSLYLFDPSTQKLLHIFSNVIGTGAAVEGSLLLPIRSGIAVANPDTYAIERIIPVDRGTYDGDVSLALAGEYVVEKRGDTVAILQAQ